MRCCRASRFPHRLGCGSQRRDTPRARHRHYHLSSNLIRTPTLKSWDLDVFQREAFNAQSPFRLPRDGKHLPPASTQWFIHERNPAYDLSNIDRVPHTSELNPGFWAAYEDTAVPLELTLTDRKDATHAGFHRTMAPLKLLLMYLSNPATSPSKCPTRDQSIYLAQCPLPSLPPALLTAVPTPELVRLAGRGDIYDSSLWLGRPPTYTPLHRDPNPNLFIQLAGRKVVRLLPPEVGDAVFERVQEACRDQGSSKAIRGEEMMVGEERQLLEVGVWGATHDSGVGPAGEISKVMEKLGQEAELTLGEALFIPKGWWHSVKGVGQGITASVNWWFR